MCPANPALSFLSTCRRHRGHWPPVIDARCKHRRLAWVRSGIGRLWRTRFRCSICRRPGWCSACGLCIRYCRNIAFTWHILVFKLNFLLNASAFQQHVGAFDFHQLYTRGNFFTNSGTSLAAIFQFQNGKARLVGAGRKYANQLGVGQCHALRSFLAGCCEAKKTFCFLGCNALRHSRGVQALRRKQDPGPACQQNAQHNGAEALPGKWPPAANTGNARGQRISRRVDHACFEPE